MRAPIVSLMAMAGLIASSTLAPAAPLAIPGQAVTEPAITLVYQRCGHGFHRGNDAWVDKGGGWHGSCLPNRPKAAGPSAGGMTADQLNQQELQRLQTGAPRAAGPGR